MKTQTHRTLKRKISQGVKMKKGGSITVPDMQLTVTEILRQHTRSSLTDIHGNVYDPNGIMQQFHSKDRIGQQQQIIDNIEKINSLKQKAVDEYNTAKAKKDAENEQHKNDALRAKRRTKEFEDSEENSGNT